MDVVDSERVNITWFIAASSTVHISKITSLRK